MSFYKKYAIFSVHFPSNNPVAPSVLSACKQPISPAAALCRAAAAAAASSQGNVTKTCNKEQDFVSSEKQLHRSLWF